MLANGIRDLIRRLKVKTHIMHQQNRLSGKKIFSIMSVTNKLSIRRHVPEDVILHHHQCHNPRLFFTSHIIPKVALKYLA